MPTPELVAQRREAGGVDTLRAQQEAVRTFFEPEPIAGLDPQSLQHPGGERDLTLRRDLDEHGDLRKQPYLNPILVRRQRQTQRRKTGRRPTHGTREARDAAAEVARSRLTLANLLLGWTGRAAFIGMLSGTFFGLADTPLRCREMSRAASSRTTAKAVRSYLVPTPRAPPAYRMP